MLLDSLVIATKQVSANAETGQVAVTSPLMFRQLAKVDNGRVVRSNPVLGNTVITQTATKLLGSPGKRTLIQYQLPANGLLPAGQAHLVITTAGGLQGDVRALEALGYLLATLVTMAVNEDLGEVSDPLVESSQDGWPVLKIRQDTTDSDVSPVLYGMIQRILSGEA